MTLRCLALPCRSFSFSAHSRGGLMMTRNRNCLLLHVLILCFTSIRRNVLWFKQTPVKLECGPMPNLMVALPNIGGALCSTPQSLADAHY